MISTQLDGDLAAFPTHEFCDNIEQARSEHLCTKNDMQSLATHGGNSLTSSLQHISESSLRIHGLLALMFPLTFEMLASLSLCYLDSELNCVTLRSIDGPKKLPLPLVVAAYLNEGDDFPEICASQLRWHLRFLSASSGAIDIRESQGQLYYASALTETMKSTLRGCLPGKGSPIEHILNRVDIAVLLRLRSVPEMLRRTQDSLWSVVDASGPKRRLYIRGLHAMHGWDESDVEAVIRRLTHDKVVASNAQGTAPWL